MRNPVLFAAFAVGMTSIQSQAEILAVEGTGIVDLFGESFGGADRFPFAGLSLGDPISFRYQFDISATISSINGMVATYELDPMGSFMQLGENILTFDRLDMRLGTYQGGSGGLGFSAYNSTLGVSAFVGFSGPDPLSMDIADPIDFDSLIWGHDFGADSDSNNLLLSIVYGVAHNAELVPAPGVLSLAMGGVLVSARRRRNYSI